MTRLEEHDGVLFEGDWLPVVGVPVAEAKAMLKDAGNISYFADAFVNGRQVPVAYLLQRGDCLEFVQIFGIKAADDLGAEKAMAQALLQAEPEVSRMVDEVYELRIPVDQKLAIIALRIFQLAKRRFGPVTDDAAAMLIKLANEFSRLAGEGQRPASSRQPRIPISERVRVDFAGGEAVIDGVHYTLGPISLAILDCLVAANGAVVSRAEMQERSETLREEDRIDRLIAKFKRDNEMVGDLIESVPGKGYRIVMPD